MYLDIRLCRFWDTNIFRYTYLSKFYIRHTLMESLPNLTEELKDFVKKRGVLPKWIPDFLQKVPKKVCETEIENEDCDLSLWLDDTGRLNLLIWMFF